MATAQQGASATPRQMTPWRMKRRERVARAEGMLQGVTAMLGPKDVAVDCGANVGKVTAALAKTGARVIAFEPDPLAYNELKEAFEGVKNVELVNAAVGVKDGVARLHRAEDFAQKPKRRTVKSSLLSGGRGMADDNYVDVDMVNFPEALRLLLKETKEIAFLKMDIEGAELELLEVMDAEGLLDPIRFTVVETHERKFPDLQPRYEKLRADFADKYSANKVNLDWI